MPDALSAAIACARSRASPAAVRRHKPSSGADIAIGGAELAGHAIGAGLADERHLFLCPILVGGGKRSLPDNVRAQLATPGKDLHCSSDRASIRLARRSDPLSAESATSA